MKNKKKKVLITFLSLIILVVGIVVCLFGFNFKNPNALTLEENKWIDENKYDVVDVAVMNDIPILSYEGEGLIYDYLNYVTDNHNIKINVIPSKLDNITEYNYMLNIVDKPSKNDVELLNENSVLLTINDISYKDISEINNLRIGVLSTDKQLIEGYLNNSTITYVEYNNYPDLKNSILDSKSAIEQGSADYQVDAVIVLKTVAIKEIIENNLNIAYHFNDLNKSFVLTTKGDKNLNSIFSKTYNTWKLQDFEMKYNQFLLSNYYNFKKLSDVEQKTLKSKNYVYGFINYGIYNHLDNNKISGLNGLILKKFNEFSGLSIKYTQYNSISKLVNDFNKNEVDFLFNIVDKNDIKIDIFETTPVFNKGLLVVTNINNNSVIDNLGSLKNKEVLALKDSYMEEFLNANGIKYKSYNDLESLIKDFGTNDIMIIDLQNYNYYKTSYLKDSKINYVINEKDSYNYIINSKESNKLFQELFDFYLSINSINKLSTQNYEIVAYQNVNILYILIGIICALAIYLVIDFSTHLRVMIKSIKRNQKVKLSKEDKIKYIDQLTSLKNRAYLNSKIESWDESETYPQSIIVIDLNNISYVNDNYGREEGDKVITEAANILIQHQLANSEIIRTDGNEFLIYLVGYSEKQIISYLRKLSKEFKGLSHGFGAASGYSIILDAIKTIDDAVNEATLNMRENKEDIDY